jgi:hypothetical protein
MIGRNLVEFATRHGEHRRYCRACENARSRRQMRTRREQLKALKPDPPAGRLSTLEASRQYGVPKATILDWGKRGLVSDPVKHGKEYWWDVEELDRQVKLYTPNSPGLIINKDDGAPVDFYLLFGRGLVNRRKVLALTQGNAAALLREAGLTAYGRNTLGHLETGRRFPAFPELVAVARALGASVDEMLPQTGRLVELSPRLFGARQRRCGDSIQVRREEVARVLAKVAEGAADD